MKILPSLIIIILIIPIASADTRTIIIKDTGDDLSKCCVNDVNNTFLASQDANYAFVFDNLTITQDLGQNNSVSWVDVGLSLDREPYWPASDNDYVTAAWQFQDSSNVTHNFIEEYRVKAVETFNLFWVAKLYSFKAIKDYTYDGQAICHVESMLTNKLYDSYAINLQWSLSSHGTPVPYIFISGNDGLPGDYPLCVNSATGNNTIPLSGIRGPITLNVNSHNPTPHNDIARANAQTNLSGGITQGLCGSACNYNQQPCSALDVHLPAFLTVIINVLTFGNGAPTHICLGDLFSFLFTGVLGLTTFLLTSFLNLIPGGGILFNIIALPFQILISIIQIFVDIFLFNGAPFGVIGLYFAHIIILLVWGSILYGFTGNITLIYKPAFFFIKITWTGILWLIITFFKDLLPFLIKTGINLVHSIANFFSNMIP